MKYYYKEHLTGYNQMTKQGIKSWGELHGNPNDFNDFSSRPFLEEVLPELSFSESSPEVLEYGTGTGPVACYLAERGFQVDARDLIPTAIEVAKKLSDKRGLEINYDVLDICNLPHDGKKYDMVVDSYCLQGIVLKEDREKVFSAIKARIKPEGYYLVSTAMYTVTRDFPDKEILDPVTEKVYTRYGQDGIFDRESEIFYELFSEDQNLKDNPEDYDHTLMVEGNWYMPRRRYRNPQSLMAELVANDFRVILQYGKDGGNLVCVLRDNTVKNISRD